VRRRAESESVMSRAYERAVDAALAAGACCVDHDERSDRRCRCDCCMNEHGPSDADMERADASREVADMRYRATRRDAGRG
jgi:hypothetical protein